MRGRALLPLVLGLALAAPAQAKTTKAPARKAPETAAKIERQLGAPSGKPRVLVAPYSGVISPVAAEFMTGAVERAAADRYDALLIELDTPGGLDLSMREIVKSIMGSRVPVIVYVYPTGSRAASAGVFITMAANVAAMAPGTNIGAAHPVSLPSFGGSSGKEDKTMEGKVTNDAAAYIKSIAEQRGRNAAWAEEAVTKSTSIPAAEALSLHVIDFIATDPAELLKAADGFSPPGLGAPLHTADAALAAYPMTRRQRALAAISDPNVAMILMSLGAAGLFIELYSPGLILPGVVGGISMILAFYSFQTLSANYAGVLLILLGMICFLLEIKVTSYGLLAVGGAASVFLGALMLFNQPMGGLSVSYGILFGSLAAVLLVVGGCAWLALRAGLRKVVTGDEGMAGAEGEALEELAPKGRVAVRGEIWEAEALDAPIPKGSAVLVDEAKGLRLKVRRK